MFDIHQRLIAMFGGLDGIRDDRLLDSALAQRQATFFGGLLHTTISVQAAAYLHLTPSIGHLLIEKFNRLTVK